MVESIMAGQGSEISNQVLKELIAISELKLSTCRYF
jgi:hypothetical protein